MHARVSTAHSRPEAVDEIRQLYERQIVPAARQQRGFRGLQVLLDRNSGRAMTISLWETAEDARASQQSDYMRQVLAALAPFLASAPEQTQMEVLIDTDR